MFDKVFEFITLRVLSVTGLIVSANLTLFLVALRLCGVLTWKWIIIVCPISIWLIFLIFAFCIVFFTGRTLRVKL